MLIIAKDAATTRHFVDFPNGYFGSQESSMKENLKACYGSTQIQKRRGVTGKARRAKQPLHRKVARAPGRTRKHDR